MTQETEPTLEENTNDSVVQTDSPNPITDFDQDFYDKTLDVAKMIYEARQKLIWQYFFVIGAIFLAYPNYGNHAGFWLAAALFSLTCLLLDAVNGKGLGVCWDVGQGLEKCRGIGEGVFSRIDGYYKKPWHQRSMTQTKILAFFFCSMTIIFTGLFVYDLNGHILGTNQTGTTNVIVSGDDVQQVKTTDTKK